MKRASLVAILLSMASAAAADTPPYDVVTHHNDIHRSGVYAGETSLNPTNVNAKGFKRLFTRRVVGQILGQPLYVRGVPVKGQPHNLVYVATSANLVYGFDADDAGASPVGSPLLFASLGTALPISGDFFHTILPTNGISSTPVIDLGSPADPSTGTLYVVARLKQDDSFHLFALELTTLKTKKNVIVSATAQNNTKVQFKDTDHLNRAALLISMNRLIVAFGSGPKNDNDCPNYHGWVLSYSLPDLTRIGAFITTPGSKGMGGIWQSGNGPAADDQGYVYVMSGNGPFQSTNPPDLPDSFIRLSNGARVLSLFDWYTPPSRDVLAACDLDLGSSGPAVIQDAGKVLGAGKSGILYVLDTNSMGKTDTALSSPTTWRGAPDCTVGQCFRVAENQYDPTTASKLACNVTASKDSCTGFEGGKDWNTVVDSYPHVHGAPVVWRMGANNYNLYVWAEQDYLKAFHFDGKQFATTPVGLSQEAAARMSMPGGLLSLSWDGANASSGVLWTSRPDPNAVQRSVSAPLISVFHDQQHFVFRNRQGELWDSYFRRGDRTWHFQQVNYNGIEAASFAISVFGAADQQHFVYEDSIANIWDAFFRRSDGTWQSQAISTKGHTPVGLVSVTDFDDQQHFTWRDADGSIWDSFFSQADHKWHFQSVDNNGHPALRGVTVSVFPSADQQHFVFMDWNKNVWDSFYVRSEQHWHFQSIDTKGHTPAALVVVSAFHDQQHFAWIDGAGAIWDSFYAQADGNWHFQSINTNGHAAAGNLVISVFDAADQQHFVYTDRLGNMFDSFYRRGDHSWQFQQIDTHKHPVEAGLSVSGFYDQQHFAWTDANGLIWDSFFAQADNKWHFQQINNTFNCMFSSGNDLMPNDAPCNAINKIVRGYVEAFNPTPARGKLGELWSNKLAGDDGVWFAKQSPPTIADGKLFVVGFPPPIPGQAWSDPGAFGRLVVYSLH